MASRMDSRTNTWTSQLCDSSDIDASIFSLPQKKIEELLRLATFKDLPYLHNTIDLAKSGCIYHKHTDMIECKFGGKLTSAAEFDSTTPNGLNQFHHKSCPYFKIYKNRKKREMKRDVMSQLRLSKIRHYSKEKRNSYGDVPCTLIQLEAIHSCYNGCAIMKTTTELFLKTGKFPSQEELLQTLETGYING